MSSIELNEGVLICPTCRGMYLRHINIEVFNRDEDASRGIHLDINEKDFSVNDKLDGNPSERRHGVIIRFSCENCEDQSVLSIAQHKGQTLMEFY